MLTTREFFGDEFYIQCLRVYEECMYFRKTIKGKPDQYQVAQLELNEPFISFWKKFK